MCHVAVMTKVGLLTKVPHPPNLTLVEDISVKFIKIDKLLNKLRITSGK